MALFDALTGNAGHAAAADQRNVLSSLIPNLAATGQAAYGQAGGLLNSGSTIARNDLGQGYGASTGAVTGGAGQALGYLGQGTQGALGQLGQARDTLTAGGGAYAPLTALANQYGQGANLYADSLGINGAQGNQNAVNAFQAGPGYQFALNQGVDAITRGANASGGLGGNSLRDTIGYGQNLANQEYSNWQNKLAPYNQLQLGATQGAATGNQAINSGVANTYGAGAQLLDSSGRAQAGVATGQGNTLADLARQYYGQLGSNDTTLGAQQAGNTIGGAQNYQGIYGGAIPQWNNTLQQDAATSNAASANSLNLGQNLLKLAAGSAGGGGSNLGGSLSGGLNSGNGSLFPSASFLQNGFGFG